MKSKRKQRLCAKAFLAFLTCIHSTLAVAATEVAITVDDLPIHASTLPSETRALIAKRFISALKKHHIIEAYGFINARKVEDAPESVGVLEEWVNAGYPLANHTYSHINLNKVSAERFIEDIRLNEPMLKRFQAVGSTYWFRYPFLHEGDTLEKRNRVRSKLGKLGYKIAQVTIDFEDWAWNNAYVRCVQRHDERSIAWLKDSYLHHATLRLDRAVIAAQKLFDRDIQHVLLLHIGVFDSLMLDDLLTAYKKRGVHFVRLAEAAADPIYAIDPGLTMSAGETFLSQVAMARGASLPPVEALPLDWLEDLCRLDPGASPLLLSR